jgi:DHA1 family bicyclomycin/chloramphenicol resistance-like MFS transporter
VNTVITDINKGQRYLGDKGLIALIAFMSGLIPLSTDLYLPALPGMVDYFDTSIKLINLTLIMFFFFFAVGTLFWGPLSDTYGRKSVLQIGLSIYIIASGMCACSSDIFQLIAFRTLQAIGAGATTAVAMAMIKDVYRCRKRESVLAVVQSMMVIAPVIAPVIGAVLLKFTSWRGLFWALSGVGFLALASSIVLEETLRIHYNRTILHTIGRLGVVLKNPGFTSLLMIFSLVVAPMMAFIAASSYIYIVGFGLSEQVYSYFFALNALCAMLGPLLYLQLSKRFKRRSIVIACFTIIAVSGYLLFSLGNINPWLFAITLIPATMSMSALRPPSANLLLEQQQEDTGTVSSLMSFFTILIGSLGMLLISFEWGNIVSTLGMMHLITGLLCGLLWVMLSGKPFVRHPPDSIKTA